MRARRLAPLLSLALLAASAGPAEADKPDVPEGYTLLYNETFDSPDALDRLAFSDPAMWAHQKAGDHGGVLALHQGGDYKPPVRSPRRIALLDTRRFGSFVLEADLQQTGRSYGHRDLCLFFGVEDPSHYYYVHIAPSPDAHAHNVMVVDGKPRTAIAEWVSEGVDWGDNKWHHVRLERNLADGTIRVYFDNMDEPIMKAKDKRHGWGYVGFGSFDDVGLIDNVKIYGPKKKNAASFFRKK